MGRGEYIAMATEDEQRWRKDLLKSDLKEFGVAAKRLANDAVKLGGLLSGLPFSNGSLLLLQYWLEMPGSLILLLVVAPNFFAVTLRHSWVGVLICLAIGCYLLQEHIRASGGFRNAFTQSHGVSNTIGIILLFVYPVWALVLWIL
ncbi:hypothetical protein Syun_015758 [Stephania yunnanensis]|uniref:Uncharacterized protein n=1 Tax=Stephania yunnanensis TaxID=152371 RepID=A0AAP0JNH5_9MAGN